MCDDCEVIDVPGDHFSILRQVRGGEESWAQRERDTEEGVCGVEDWGSTVLKFVESGGEASTTLERCMLHGLKSKP